VHTGRAELNILGLKLTRISRLTPSLVQHSIVPHSPSFVAFLCHYVLFSCIHLSYTTMRPSLRISWPRHASLLPRHPRAPPQSLQSLQSLTPRRIATTSAQNAAPVDLPKLLVAHGSKDHNSLASFIDYANRRNLQPMRSIYIGTLYEYTTALSLMRLGFSLLRTGKKNDAGIDLIGHWVLAPLSEPMPVFIQCKARSNSVGPCHVRELEGSYRGVPPEWKDKSVLGLLVTNLKATKGTMEAIGRSRWPMGFVMVSKQGLIQQFVWNKAASDRGLEGVGVTVRHTPRALLPESELDDAENETPKQGKRLSKSAVSGTQRDIQLTWMGSPIFPDRTNLDKETLDLFASIAPRMAPPIVISHRGPPPTKHLAPSPRGGQIRKPRKSVVEKEETESQDAAAPRRRAGRPKGSKNKAKILNDTG
jgi:hypothetical protein